MNTNSIKYHVLKALAAGDTPMTCEEIWDVLPEDKRPKTATGGSANEWDALTSHTSKLYGDHFVDRRKRDVRWKPMEYWLASKGRKTLERNGDLPDEEAGAAPISENTAEAVADGADPGMTKEIQEILEDPETEAAEFISGAFAGLVDTVHDLDNAVDNLRENAVTEDELKGRLENGDFDHLGEAVEAVEQAGSVSDLEQTLETVKSQVQAISKAQSRLEGLGGDFAPYIERLRQLERQGYGLHSGSMEVSYGGNVVEVSVKAKPESKVSNKGPADSAKSPIEGERVTVSKEETDD